MVHSSKTNLASQYGVVLLAGGKSSRMGTNKALLPILGKPNIEHIRDQLRSLVPAPDERGASPHFVVVTNEPESYRFLGETMVGDRHPGLGPLAGIQVGLQASPCDWNLVVACDMPMVTAEVGLFLMELAGADRSANEEPTGFDAVVPVIGGQLHPLFAVYHKRCANPIEEMLLSSKLRMIYLLDSLRVKQVTEADFPNHINIGQVFFNMNNPEDYQQVLKWLSEGGRKREVFPGS
ncbi:molybdenum cofactor guanylyltransferase [Effusibacillus lacus]|uniref:Probable molybdenum cofactor guanylyltransferase n=1 Tax=Effusibacillus lacus TaxID=1348429 RepID=A0A292YM28_9BACL|nr:molybdenum cofactor guanylyltransferase [Effusibacillus lacus]TCS71429.1 molybdenum cofactor guanylyltransferase [Effusibacillus lacus]GAX89959.1 molybdenum cofactor guanylyltransferase [Effusibacillus lacus]